MIKSLIIFLLLATGSSSFADDIEFPEEELARETVLPVFDKRRAVLNRNVLTQERFELGIGGGLEMNEPYYNDFMFAAQGTYNFNETSAVNVQGLMWMGGLSNYGEQLKSGRCGDPDSYCPFDAELAPHPEWGLFVNYQFIAYYGKISVSKQSVMNLNLFGLAGLGYINLGESNTIGLNLGVGQNFFITNNVGIRADLRWLIFNGPNPASRQLLPGSNASADSFEDRIFYNSQLGLSIVVIL
ncbi:MAG TPA: outer membrane beta-barrel domain-containing protein [Bdellovibrionales bacterium]|nr:outer membrane beta-barrel domain-containing protein [Bdellovibrionales bacterium]